MRNGSFLDFVRLSNHPKFSEGTKRAHRVYKKLNNTDLPLFIKSKPVVPHALCFAIVIFWF